MQFLQIGETSEGLFLSHSPADPEVQLRHMKAFSSKRHSLAVVFPVASMIAFGMLIIPVLFQQSLAVKNVDG